MSTLWKKLVAGTILAVGITGAAWGDDWAHRDHDRDNRVYREYNRDRDHDRDHRDRDWKRESYRYHGDRDRDRDRDHDRGWYRRGPNGRPGYYQNGWWNHGFFGR